MSEKGYVYVLTNPSFKADWVKIGKSSRLPDVRSKELYNTAVPLPYEVYATLCTERYHQAEKLIHRSIDRISHLRINASREFFNIPPEKAFEILEDIADLLGEEAEVNMYGDNVVIKTEQNGAKGTKGEVFDFYKRGIKDGEVICFVGDPSIKAVVVSNRQVLFEGETYYLSPLVREIYRRKGTVSSSGAYQGPAFFTYFGKKLIDIPMNRLESSIPSE